MTSSFVAGVTAANVAGLASRQLDRSKFILAADPEERQRNADFVVEVPGAFGSRNAARQCRVEHVPGRRLAHTSRDSNDSGVDL